MNHFRIVGPDGKPGHPMETRDVIRMIESGKITPDTILTDDAGGAALPATRHPALASHFDGARPAPAPPSTAPVPDYRTPPGRSKSPLLYFGLAIGGLLLMCLVHWVIQAIGNDNTQPYVVSREFVKQVLKNPERATFPDAKQSVIVEKRPMLYRVSAYVEAPNSKGTIVRRTWESEVFYKGWGDWRLRYLRIGDQVGFDETDKPLPGESEP